MSVKCSEVVNFNISMGYYRLISQIFNEELKYIHDYKSLLKEHFKKALNLQVNSGAKLGKLPEEFENATWIDPSPILILTQLIPKIIQKQIENIKNFLDKIENNVKSLDDFFKEKASKIADYQQKYDESSNDLIKKYIDVEKIKISFFNSINKSENIIIKYNNIKNKLEEIKNGKLKIINNELKILNDKEKEYKSQKKSQINSTKRHENEYKTIIKNSAKCEDKFILTINESIDGIKNVTSDIADKFKEIILNFLSFIRDSFKVPLDLIDSDLDLMKNLNEKEIIIKTMESTFNNQKKFLHITPIKYNLKLLESVNDENIKNRNSKGSNGKSKKEEKKNINQKGLIKFEHGFEEMSYFEDDMALLSVKEMFENFELINHNGLNLIIEEEKNEAKKYMNKLISNFSHENNTIINDNNILTINDNIPFSDEEKNALKNLLKKHHNRVIFLHKLNDYRIFSLFELKEKEYSILGEFFSFLIDISKKEKDYHCVEMIIILSKTYYKLENDKKIYLQNLIQNKDFWEELLIYSINKEFIKKKDEDNLENEKIINQKNSNIIFSQLLSIIDNMYDFDVEGDVIKQIIEPKIEYYKIDDKLKATLYDEIKSKLKEKNDKKEDIKKYNILNIYIAYK